TGSPRASSRRRAGAGAPLHVAGDGARHASNLRPRARARAGMTASIDVVVPTFNGWDLTRRCLVHLREQTVPHVVTVADNASTDGTAEHLRSEFPEVRIVELAQNLGFPAACNRGVAAGDGEFVVLLNNDVECPTDFLERLVSPFADERVGM